MHNIDNTYSFSELYILGASLLTNAPIPIVITLDAVKNLKTLKKVCHSINFLLKQNDIINNKKFRMLHPAKQ